MAKVKNLALAENEKPEPIARAIGEEQVVNAASALIANTDAEAANLVGLYNACPDLVHVVSPGVDLQKLLVPTPPIYNVSRTQLIAGKENNVGVVAGMIQSFYDAPGQLSMDGTDTLFLDNGFAQVEKGSVFKEELREINIGSGIEYDYNKTFAVRGGYFHESATKGNRQFFTFGVGLKYQMLQIDLSYIATIQRNNPLANTVRYSVRFNLGNNK
jgi:hypothetical protein